MMILKNKLIGKLMSHYWQNRMKKYWDKLKKYKKKIIKISFKKV